MYERRADKSNSTAAMARWEKHGIPCPRRMGPIDRRAALPVRARCTCEWLHPVTGDVDVAWPAVLDSRCHVHVDCFPESGVAEMVDLHEKRHATLWSKLAVELSDARLNGNLETQEIAEVVLARMAEIERAHRPEETSAEPVIRTVSGEMLQAADIFAGELERLSNGCDGDTLSHIDRITLRQIAKYLLAHPPAGPSCECIEGEPIRRECPLHGPLFRQGAGPSGEAPPPFALPVRVEYENGVPLVVAADGWRLRGFTRGKAEWLCDAINSRATQVGEGANDG